MNEATISDVICRISVCEKRFNGNQMRSSLSVELREPRNISFHSDSRLFTSGFYKLFMTHRFLATPIARPSEPSSIYPGRKCGMYRKVLAPCISHRDKPFYYVLFAMLLKSQSALTQHREKIVSQPKSIKENPQEKVQKRARNKVRLHTTYYYSLGSSSC